MTASSATAIPVTGGTAIGRYRICNKLAAGGMASVYLARMEGPYGFERLVALKLIHPHLALKPDFIKMFLDEARLASRISHPNVAAVIDFGQHGDSYFLAMNYIFGETLVSACKELLAAPEILGSAHWQACAARIIADAAEGLHAAHELRDESGNLLNVVHRDVSPDNIFVTYDGVVKVVDFGVARAEGQIHQTEAGTIKGKYAYMAPEMLEAERPIDRRADVWALGVVLWELLTCRRLFKRDTEPQTLIAVASDAVEPPSVLAPSVPLPLDRIALKALARDPDERYQNARELSRDLKRFVAASEEMVDTPEIGELISRLHPEQRATKQALMERARTMTWKQSGSQIIVGPSTAGLLAAARPSEQTLVPSQVPQAAERNVPEPRPPRGRGVWIALALIAMAVGAGATVFAVVRSGASNQAVAQHAADAGAARVAVDAGAAPVTPDAASVAAVDARPAEPDAAAMVFKPDQTETPRSRARKPKPAPVRRTQPEPVPTDDGDAGDTVEDAVDAGSGNPGPGGAIASVLDNPIAVPKIEPPKPPPPVKRLVLDATATVRRVKARGSMPRSKVERAIQRVSKEFRGCYVTAARQAKRDAKTRVAIELTIDEQGFARDVKARGGALPGLSKCVSKIARRIRTREPPDVGGVKVSFEVAFTPRT